MKSTTINSSNNQQKNNKSSKSKGNFYVTSPIYYVNDAPHIGHAYTSLACDVIARFKRLDDYKVHFLTGTDEHGQKVEKSAKQNQQSNLDFCDQISNKFRKLADFFNYSYDNFIRTTELRHKESVTKFWMRLEKNGWIYKDVYQGWYAVRDEAFYGEDELISGKAPSGAEVVWHKEESYFFKLSAFTDKLLALYQAVPDFIEPESKRNEVISFVKSGLKDLSISRTSFKWGINVPSDQNHIIYVWLDALTNYISALDFANQENQLYQDFWCNTENSPIHIVGKDILRFHTVYWPAFLMAADLPLPNRVFAHGWWTNNGEKISKSLGNVIDPFLEVEWLKTLGLSQESAVDYFRYFLIKEVPFGNDGNYCRKNFINRVNAELVNNIGNLVQRCLVMIEKNCASQIPDFSDNQNQEQIELSKKADQALQKVTNLIDKLAFDQALNIIGNFASEINKYFNDSAPWNLKKNNQIEEMNSVLYFTTESIRKIAILLLAFVPSSANKMLDLLNINFESRNFAAFKNPISSGHEIKQPKIIFPRIENLNS